MLTGSLSSAAGRRLFRLLACGLPALCVAWDSVVAQDSAGAAPFERFSERKSPLAAIRDEGRRYLTDTVQILGAPLHWDVSQWERAGVALAAIGVLVTEDDRIDAAVSRNRSASTDVFSRVVTPFGSYVAVGLSAGALAGGLAFHNGALRDTGRDAVEAELIAAGLVTPLLKTVTGRWRPVQGSDADEFHALSGNQSFPSGHATEAFAVASVFAARSDGWVVPAISYALACGVAFARVNDRAHLASDVVGGAIIGTLIGRSVVSRHRPSPAPRLILIPITSARGGVGVSIDLGGRR